VGDVATIPGVFSRWLDGARRRLKRGARDERGAVAVFFAVSLVLLAPLAIGVVDIYMSSSQRARLQDALDAAALYTARSGATNPDEIAAIGLRALNANLSESDQARLVSTSFVLVDSTVEARAELRPETIASELWHHGNMTVTTNVVRASNNLEVALVLDITGSMAGSKIEDLKDAAKELIDLVVQDEQTPYYSKLAIVPYSNSVNAGELADELRGETPAPIAITGATKADPVVVTAANHGFANGDYVRINGVSGMTQINDKTFRVANKTNNTFELRNIDGRNYGKYTGGGSIYCTTYGCEYYRFTNADGGTNLYQATSCISERTGTHKYNDTSPSTANLGLVYGPVNGGFCPSATIKPMSTDKTELKALIDTLPATGSTAGHIGIAWGWYMISPNFGSLWPNAISRPAAYGEDELLKVVVIMTDGDFNTAYCNGVVAANSGSGSGANSTHINCNATNGTAYTQAAALCTNMKAQGVVIYTVGFNVSKGSSAATIMSSCATDAEHTYMPSSGQDLQDAFRAIAQDINSLRLAR
jgi:Flp pilus assembly protein TadG